MKIHRFTGQDGKPIYINLEQILAIRTVENFVVIHVGVPNSNGIPFPFVVQDILDDVLAVVRDA